MPTRAAKFIRLLRSRDAADRIYLRERILRIPVIGSVIGASRKLAATLRQRSPEAYVKMQKRFYDLYADKVSPGIVQGDWVIGSWRAHDEWADYDEFLMKYVPRNETWVAIDYGCGPGRNLRRWSPIFARIDGVDISQKNLDNARVFLQGLLPAAKKPNLYLTDGMDCGAAPRDSYDFAFSTVCIQHICAYDVRFSIFKSLFACLKPGGRLSIQMGFGVPSPQTVPYRENYFAALGTNRAADVAISSPKEIEEDLTRIGFVSFESWIRPVGPGDIHPNWIFFTAVKPL
jgi:SAM-dependent methyltransferase